jgi:hypothetical protein
MSNKAAIDMYTLDKAVFIVTERDDKTIYTIEADSLKDVLDCLKEDRRFAPEDDARVFFASLHGISISPYDSARMITRISNQ